MLQITGSNRTNENLVENGNIVESEVQADLSSVASADDYAVRCEHISRQLVKKRAPRAPKRKVEKIKRSSSWTSSTKSEAYIEHISSQSSFSDQESSDFGGKWRSKRRQAEALGVIPTMNTCFRKVVDYRT